MLPISPRIAQVLAACVLIASTTAQAQDIAGKKITVNLDKKLTGPVPITIPYDGPNPVVAPISLRKGDNKFFPGTLRNGQLTFVINPPLKKGAHTLEVSRYIQDEPPAVTATKDDDANIIRIAVAGEFFTAYHYSPEDRKPFLWPLNAEGGASVTRDFPMGPEDRTTDHPHHTSFWTAYGDLNGADYWEYGDRTGWQHTQTIDYGSGDAYAWIETNILWQDKDHNPVIDEHRTYRFYNTPAATRLFDVTVQLTATHGDVKFGDTKEGGLVGLRMADALRERGGTGLVTTSEGVTGARKAWGKPAAWCDYSGTLEGIGPRGITVFDHPTSFRHPTHWHVRDYGLMGANAFGYSHFYNGKKNGDHLLKQGDTLTFRYRIYVHSGDAKDARVADHYQNFATPPKTTWLE